MAVTIGYLGGHDEEVWLSEPLGTNGDMGGTLTIGSETMTVLSGHGTRKFLVARGEEGGSSHTIGSTVTLSGALEISQLITADT